MWSFSSAFPRDEDAGLISDKQPEVEEPALCTFSVTINSLLIDELFYKIDAPARGSRACLLRLCENYFRGQKIAIFVSKSNILGAI